MPNWIWVEGCDKTGCSVPNGSTRTLRTGFNSPTTHYRLKGTLRTFLFGIEFEIEQPEELKNLCEHVIGGCPILQGAGERIGELTIEAKSPVSGVTVRVEVSVIDADTNAVVACAGK